MANCPLVLIEWEDSAQPIPNWLYLSNFEASSGVQCMSVGWLIHDSDIVKILAPNMGDLLSESSVQVSGVIRIPARCVVQIVQLDEPTISASCLAPSSRPETGQRQRET